MSASSADNLQAQEGTLTEGLPEAAAQAAPAAGRAAGRPSRSHARQAFIRKHARPIWALFALLTLGFALFCTTLGRYPLGVDQVLQALGAFFTGNMDSLENVVRSVVFNLRLPRIVLAIALGAGLACAGAAFQSLFSNPLATPDTLGVTSGACVGAVVAIMLSADMFTTQVIALVSGLASVALTVAISHRKGKTDIVMLVLSGVIVSAIFSAVISMLKYVADPNDKLPAITYWLMGSLSGQDFESLALGLPFIVVGIVIIFALRWRLNILTLSEDEARAAGVQVQHLRMLAIIASTMITASCVSMCGQVGWVGLLVPHCARMLCGNDNKLVVPFSIVFGALFMLAIDTVSRTMLASEIPVSVLTALIGAPIFIVLLRRTKGGWS